MTVDLEIPNIYTNGFMNNGSYKNGTMFDRSSTIAGKNPYNCSREIDGLPSLPHHKKRYYD